jgi:hypothetical protein
MAEILRRARQVVIPRYALQFDWEGKPDCGFLFDCDAKGVVQNLSDLGRQNYEKCVSNTHDRKVIARGICDFTSYYHQPALLRCDCGAEFELADSMTNHCECGRMYNGAGQELAHPRLWGEETGERFDDFGQPLL